MSYTLNLHPKMERQPTAEQIPLAGFDEARIDPIIMARNEHYIAELYGLLPQMRRYDLRRAVLLAEERLGIEILVAAYSVTLGIHFWHDDGAAARVIEMALRCVRAAEDVLGYVTHDPQLQRHIDAFKDCSRILDAYLHLMIYDPPLDEPPCPAPPRLLDA